jgi:hypothetical protein
VQSVTDPMQEAFARRAVTVMRPRSSFAPALAPSFGAALVQRVRFAGGEVPLWSLITPLVVIVALGAAFGAAAIAAAAAPTVTPPPAMLSAEPSASALTAPPAPVAPSASPSSETPAKPTTLLELVQRGDEAALKALGAKAPRELGVEEAVALSIGEGAKDLLAARALHDRVAHDPGLIKDPALLSALRRYTDDPETAREALATMLDLPGPLSADLIYDVWTSTAAHTTATDLARSLILTKELRAKASPTLGVALDLRNAETCEQARDLLPKAIELGDKRSFHLLAKLTRHYGCGPNKRQDCYTCLRDGKDLENALKAVKTRREPRPFGG